jgi:hypothetical protein
MNNNIDMLSGLAAFADAVVSCPSAVQALKNDYDRLACELNYDNPELNRSIIILTNAIINNINVVEVAEQLIGQDDIASKRAGHALKWAISHR